MHRVLVTDVILIRREDTRAFAVLKLEIYVQPNRVVRPAREAHRCRLRQSFARQVPVSLFC